MKKDSIDTIKHWLIVILLGGIAGYWLYDYKELGKFYFSISVLETIFFIKYSLLRNAGKKSSIVHISMFFVASIIAICLLNSKHKDGSTFDDKVAIILLICFLWNSLII